jgi:membrane protease YdiL (CAAX protease family)
LPSRTVISSAIGIAFVSIFPFLNWEPVLRRLPIPGITMQFAIASALASISFGINKRRLKFFHIRGLSWRDIGAAILAFLAILVLIAMAETVVNHFATSETASDSPSHDIADYPLGLALATAITAGVLEEFIYRGFILEELGELINSRWVAAGFSTILFGLAHYVNSGWSLEMISPALAGVVITLLYLSRCNLTICMLLHTTIDTLHVLWRQAN